METQPRQRATGSIHEYPLDAPARCWTCGSTGNTILDYPDQLRFGRNGRTVSLSKREIVCVECGELLSETLVYDPHTSLIWRVENRRQPTLHEALPL